MRAKIGHGKGRTCMNLNKACSGLRLQRSIDNFVYIFAALYINVPLTSALTLIRGSSRQDVTCSSDQYSHHVNDCCCAAMLLTSSTRINAVLSTNQNSSNS